VRTITRKKEQVMKKIYEEVSMEIIFFDNVDVITTSGITNNGNATSGGGSGNTTNVGVFDGVYMDWDLFDD
jgi:outer membrane protein W